MCNKYTYKIVNSRFEKQFQGKKTFPKHEYLTLNTNL